MKLIEVTYTVTVPDDAPEGVCEEARKAFGFAWHKHQLRLDAVMNGLKRIDPVLKDATLEVASSHPLDYVKGATAAKVREVKQEIEDARQQGRFENRRKGDQW